MPDVGANATTDVCHEVIAAGVIGVTRHGIVVGVSIESEVLATDSSQQLSRNGFGKLRGPDGIDSVEDWTIGLDPSVLSLAPSPGKLSFDPQAAGQEEICTDAGV
jgi:hypothetical protein